MEAGILVGLRPAPLLPQPLPSASGSVWKWLSPLDADLNWDKEKSKKGWEMLRWAQSRGGKGKADHGLPQHGVWLLSHEVGVVQLQGVFQCLLRAKCSSYRWSHKLRLLQAQLPHHGIPPVILPDVFQTPGNSMKDFMTIIPSYFTIQEKKIPNLKTNLRL